MNEGIQISVDALNLTTKLQEKLLALIDDDEVKIGVNQIIGERANKYVPMKSGALRASMEVDPDSITWGSDIPYAHYQYEGVVYAPNRPITSQGTVIGWYTPVGVTKAPTDRELGIPGEWKGWVFGYSTPDTTHHWVDKMLQLERRGMNNQITAYLKREARNRNL